MKSTSKKNQIKYSWTKSSISKIIWMVKVQGIVEQNKNAHHKAKKMKPKDYRAETYIKTAFVQK